jgi:hypothetical protein
MIEIFSIFSMTGQYLGRITVTSAPALPSGCAGLVMGLVGVLFFVSVCVPLVLAITLVLLILITLCSAVPLLTRIFIHPRVLRSHFINVCLMVVFVGAYAYFTRESSVSNQMMVNTLITLPVLGLATLLPHGLIARFYPRKVAGNGYGLLNVYALLPWLRPTFVLTLLQDGLLLALVIWIFSVAGQINWWFVALIGFILVGYTWIYDWRYRDLRWSAADEKTKRALGTDVKTKNDLTAPQPLSTADELAQVVDLMAEGKHKQARQLLTEIRRDDPTNAEVWYLTGVLSSDADKKRIAFQRALSINPQHKQANAALRRIARP